MFQIHVGIAARAGGLLEAINVHAQVIMLEPNAKVSCVLSQTSYISEMRTLKSCA